MYFQTGYGVRVWNRSEIINHHDDDNDNKDNGNDNDKDNNNGNDDDDNNGNRGMWGVNHNENRTMMTPRVTSLKCAS